MQTCKSVYAWRPSEYLAPGYKKSNDFYTIGNLEFLFHQNIILIIKKILITGNCPENIDIF